MLEAAFGRLPEAAFSASAVADDGFQSDLNYNKYGERVREGIGWMGDLGSGNGSPGSLQGPEDSSGNTDPDYHPGIGNAPAGI